MHWFLFIGVFALWTASKGLPWWALLISVLGGLALAWAMKRFHPLWKDAP